MWNDTNVLHWRKGRGEWLAGSRSRSRASVLGSVQSPFRHFLFSGTADWLVGRALSSAKPDGVKGTHKPEAKRSLVWPFL
jgi:hypothetical protein